MNIYKKNFFLMGINIFYSFFKEIIEFLILKKITTLNFDLIKEPNSDRSLIFMNFDHEI